MVIYLPSQHGNGAEETPLLDELTPREIVRELDKYVIGQADAKKAVAVALRIACAANGSIPTWPKTSCRKTF